MGDKELIEEARKFLDSDSAQFYDASLVRDLVDALEAATGRVRQAEAELRDMLRVDIPSLKAERGAALAAVERVRAVVSRWGSVLRVAQDEVLAALAGKEKNDE